ncbi:MAG: 4Fe-4S binding protein, partial [Acidobacteria bacterium]|nr:4Fe-4S binding protein [Acidobacteriota bacterium]
TCVGSCPTNSIFLHETATIEFLETCTECGLCIPVCPVGSIGRISISSTESGYEPAEEAEA